MFVFRSNTRAWIPPQPFTQANFSFEAACAGKLVEACDELAPAYLGVAHTAELSWRLCLGIRGGWGRGWSIGN